MLRHVPRAALLAIVGSALLAGSALAQGPPPPVAANGHPVQALASGIPTPTAFAFSGSTIFAGSGPAERGKAKGGLFVVANGKATRIASVPPVVFGLAQRAGTLYVSTGPAVLALSGWNGKRFARQRTVYQGGKGFPGFNGLAFGPDGRLYAGISLRSMKFDHRRDPARFAHSVVSMTPSGGDLRVVARGLRQPFQLVFPTGSRHPVVTVLGQDSGTIPPDALVIAKPGLDFGFPTCTHATEQPCKRFAKPLALLPKHASPMGIGAIGSQLYVALFGGLSGKGDTPEVVTIPMAGGAPTPFLTGFAAPVVALGIHAGRVYVGDLTGTVYAVAA